MSTNDLCYAVAGAMMLLTGGMVAWVLTSAMKPAGTSASKTSPIRAMDTSEDIQPGDVS